MSQDFLQIFTIHTRSMFSVMSVCPSVHRGRGYVTTTYDAIVTLPPHTHTKGDPLPPTQWTPVSHPQAHGHLGQPLQHKYIYCQAGIWSSTEMPSCY